MTTLYEAVQRIVNAVGTDLSSRDLLLIRQLAEKRDGYNRWEQREIQRMYAAVFIRSVTNAQ